MPLYITRAAVEVDGHVITDFKAFVEKAIIPNKRVNLMYKSGSAALTQRYEFDLDYVEPQINPYDWFGTAGKKITVTVDYDGGERVDFGSCAIVNIGDATVDGENEKIRKIEFMAETRNGATGA